MYAKLWNYLRGSVLLRCQSAAPERVLNLCAVHEIPFWDVKWQTEECFTLRTTRQGARRLAQSAAETDARLERLEEQVYFQERTLSALNEAITLQQRQLDDLQGRMEAVEEKFRELWELVGNEGGEATVPPHYMKLA